MDAFFQGCSTVTNYNSLKKECKFCPKKLIRFIVKRILEDMNDTFPMHLGKKHHWPYKETEQNVPKDLDISILLSYSLEKGMKQIVPNVGGLYAHKDRAKAGENT